MNVLILLLVLSGCVSTGDTKLEEYGNIPATAKDHVYEAKAREAMIATAHPLATEAGLEMLRKGGNAADAAAAVSFAIGVVRPQSTGIGGGGFLLYNDQRGEGVSVYDFRERAPMLAKRDMYLDPKGEPKDFVFRGEVVKNASVNGHLSVGVPGLVAGVVEFHQKHGLLKLSDVMAPAIRLARDGFPVYRDLEMAIARRKHIIEIFPSSRKILFPEGVALKEGDVFKQVDLANTLELISKNGKDGFYKGVVAENIINEIKRGKGIITQKDLDDYEVKIRKPVVGEYRGHKVYSMPPPSSGGVHIVQMLNILSHVDYGKMGHNTGESLHYLAEAMRRAFADRAKYLGDPDFVNVPVKGLISKQYAKVLFDEINAENAANSKTVHAGNPMAHESSSTTHFSIVDKWGNAVSSTQTINFTFGSCVVAEGTGVFLNDEMDDFSKKPGVPNAFGLLGSEANAIAAKKTMLSSMSPTIVFNERNEVELVVGSPGGPRIISATLQTILNYIDHKLPLKHAVHAPRIHHQWWPDHVWAEDVMPKAVAKALEAKGHVVKHQDRTIGDVQAIARTDEGWVGVSDWRSTGSPKGL